MRSGRDRDAEWRGDMELLVQPADRAVLSRSDGQPISILGLRSAAGQRRGGDSEPEQLAGAEFYGLAANGSGRRERLHRPRSRHPGIIYGGTVARQDLHNEQVQQMPPTLMYPGEYRKTWTVPLVFSEIEPHVLYFSAQVLFRTADGGNSWQKISPDLTREEPGVPANLDAATAADAPA